MGQIRHCWRPAPPGLGGYTWAVCLVMACHDAPSGDATVLDGSIGDTAATRARTAVPGWSLDDPLQRTLTGGERQPVPDPRFSENVPIEAALLVQVWLENTNLGTDERLVVLGGADSAGAGLSLYLEAADGTRIDGTLEAWDPLGPVPVSDQPVLFLWRGAAPLAPSSPYRAVLSTAPELERDFGGAPSERRFTISTASQAAAAFVPPEILGVQLSWQRIPRDTEVCCRVSSGGGCTEAGECHFCWSALQQQFLEASVEWYVREPLSSDYFAQTWGEVSGSPRASEWSAYGLPDRFAPEAQQRVALGVGERYCLTVGARDLIGGATSSTSSCLEGTSPPASNTTVSIVPLSTCDGQSLPYGELGAHVEGRWVSGDVSLRPPL